MPAAALLVALLCLLTVALAFNVSRERIKYRVPHGEGPNHELSRSIRAHMNSVEHLVPLGLLLVLAGQLGVTEEIVIPFGAAAIVARLLLSAGILLKGRFVLRRWGAYSTYVIELVLVGFVVEAALR